MDRSRLNPSKREIPPRIRAIMQDAAERYNLTLNEMIEGPKVAHACAARSMAIRQMRDLGLSYSQIGRHLKMGHTSVMYYTRARFRVKPGPVVIPCPDYSGEWNM